MGLDQYAYTKQDQEQKEVATWRKHPNLQGFIENIWRERTPRRDRKEEFNCVEVELTATDINNLRNAVLGEKLPRTKGFFFGSDSDEYYYSQDLEFCDTASKLINAGEKVFYSSWW